MNTNKSNIKSNPKLLLVTRRIKNIVKLLGFATFFGLAACGGGSSSSGGGSELSKELVRCVTTENGIVTNNCTFNVNVRYFTSAITANAAPTEAITELAPGQQINVAPHDGNQTNAVPGCTAPLRPSVLYQSTNVTCIG